MSRKIEFRVWSKRDQRYLKSRGRLGFEKFRSTTDGYFMPIHIDLSWLINDNHIIQQFTGLLDKNDKEIYEGDILEDLNGLIGIVEYYNNEARYRFKCLNTQEFGWYNEEITKETVLNNENFKIIGNVCENPDLIEKY